MTALADLTWQQAAQLSGALLVVPVGSTEQHGPQLPLSTDTDIALALAQRLPDVVVAPPVAYGASGEHAGFAGTLSIGLPALELLLVELCRSATDSFDRVLLLNAHGGNLQALQRAVTLLRSEDRDVRAWSPHWRGDAHAGYVETSLQLALAPDRVRVDLAEPGAVEPLAALLPRLRASGVRAISPNGVLGDPTGATADHGRDLIAAAVDDLCAFLASW